MRSLLVPSALLLTVGLTGLTAATSSADEPGIDAAPSAPAASAPVHRSAPSSAPRADGAAVVIGSTGSGTSIGCAAGAAVTQIASGSGSLPSYAAPGAGVLTKILTDANEVAGSFRVMLLGPGADADHRTVQSLTAPLTLAPSTLNTFPVRIPVVANAVLGMYNPSGGISCSKTTTNPADVYGGSIFDPTSGLELPLASQITSRQLNLAAVWEPDVDGDGFGDVSQDSCPQSTAYQICPTPDTSARAPKVSTKRKIKVTFTSSIPGSTFTCSVDGKTAKPCTSPFRKRYSLGKHKVVVTAISPLGIADAAPAKVKFRRIPPRR